MNRVMKYRLAISIIAFLISILSFAQVPAKPSTAYAVNDYASIFTESQRSEMESRLVDLAAKTSNRIVVVTVDDLGDMDANGFAYNIGEQWGVGSSKFNNGIVVLVKPKTALSRGDVAIAVGYGLEGVVPDATAKMIIERKMIPNFKNDDYYQGVASALDDLIPLVTNEISYKEL
jgi:uncharacterized protein